MDVASRKFYFLEVNTRLQARDSRAPALPALQECRVWNCWCLSVLNAATRHCSASSLIGRVVKTRCPSLPLLASLWSNGGKHLHEVARIGALQQAT